MCFLVYKVISEFSIFRKSLCFNAGECQQWGECSKRTWISHNRGFWTNWQRNEDYFCSKFSSQNHSKCSLPIVEMVSSSNLISCRHFLFTENGICEVIEMTCKFGGDLVSSSFKAIKRNRFGEIWIFHVSIFKSKGSSFFINMQLFIKKVENYNKNTELWKKIIFSLNPSPFNKLSEYSNLLKVKKMKKIVIQVT